MAGFVDRGGGGTGGFRGCHGLLHGAYRHSVPLKTQKSYDRAFRVGGGGNVPPGLRA